MSRTPADKVSASVDVEPGPAVVADSFGPFMDALLTPNPTGRLMANRGGIVHLATVQGETPICNPKSRAKFWPTSFTTIDCKKCLDKTTKALEKWHADSRI